MKIEEAKRIPVQKLVEDLGGRYSHTDRHGDLWYYSPFRPTEETPSFKVNVKLNTWHDFGMSGTNAHKMQGSGGDVMDLWCDFKFKDRRTGLPEVLQALEKFNPIARRGEHLQPTQSKEQPAEQNKEPRYKILKIEKTIKYDGLKDELNRRRISLKLAKEYLKQGLILDTVKNRKYTGFLFENDQGGCEVSIPNPHLKKCFKTCIGEKASTRILVADEINSADVFEGFWDLLSWLEIKATITPLNHTYVLNSTSMIKETSDKIIAFKETIKNVFLFMDNDDAGYKATHAMALALEPHGFEIAGKEWVYKDYKDVNDYWVRHDIKIPT